MANIDTRNLNAVAGAVYFTVGRGTEGGPASYRLSVAGVDRSEWGQVSAVAANSGYSIGTIQVDLGQRGTWPLGETSGRPLRAGETTYVDGIISQASDYARRNSLPFPSDTTQLRADLLTHGDGGELRNGRHRSSISFIDAGTRESINAWASSDEGRSWIHEKVDYPQVRSATQTAMTILDQHGRNIPEDRRFEAINILAKTANQYPNGLDKLQTVLRNGGDYDALLNEAKAIKADVPYYAGPKAASVAETYENNYNDPNRQPAMDRAHGKVSRADYSPASERNDPDVQQALASLPTGQQRRAATNTVLELGESGREVRKLESNLAGLGYADAQGRRLAVDGNFSGETKQAVETYQRTARLEPVDGRAGPQTLGVIDRDVRGLQENLKTLGAVRANGQIVGVDGYYGEDTRLAVTTFQQTHGLDPSGIADPATRAAIETAARERTQGGQTQPQPGTQTAPANPANPAQPAQTAPANPAQPAAPGTTAPPVQANGPRSFNDVMRVVLPPQNGVNPHMTSDFGPRTLNGKADDHGGVDFNYVGGQSGINLRHPTVHSPVSGTVVRSGGGYNMVGIRDDQGNVHQILHLDSRSVQVTNPPTRVQAGDPIGTMGGEVPGARDIAQHVHYQLRDPNDRIIDPEAYWNNPQRAQGAAPAADALADGRLQRNERGEPVKALQQNLETLGVQFQDAQGRRIAATGFYGAQTETAVRDFQRTHQLDPTGVADPATRQAIETAARERTQGEPSRNTPTAPQPSSQAPSATPSQPEATRPAAAPANAAGNLDLLTHPANPHNPLYNQILGKVHEEERKRGIPSGEYSQNLAAALTVEAVRERITQVDRIEFSRDSSLARVVQISAMGDRPEINRNTDGVATQQAVRQSVQESSEQTAQVANNVLTQDANEQRQRQERSEKALSQ
ncbi:peptidoglycan-binding protein [Lysobacter sp. CA199]|uniref:peptidoglycan-binding protein n=1 Tax=Lysobacter sp. CA199 TaxID=3455608 RepID=UPI003F8D225B